MKGVLCHVINAGRLRCHTPRATSRMHHVARPSGAGTGRAVPDYRSQAKHRRRARQGRVTPRLDLMTLGGNRLWFPTPTRVAGGFAPVSAPTGTTRERQLQHTSLTLGKATTCSPDQGQTITLPTVCSPTTDTGGDHQRRCRLLAITFIVIIRQTGNTPGANNPSSKKRETTGTLVSINGSHSRRGKGVGWVALPPPHITVCFFSHRWGRASLLQQPPSHCGARAPRVDRTQDGIIWMEKKQQDKEAEIQ